MEILLIIIYIIAVIVCSISIGWHLRIKKESEQEKGGRITLDGDVVADSRYYYIRVFESDQVEHLRVPKTNANHNLDVAEYGSPVEIIIKRK